MLVPSMTLEELRAEMEKDYAITNRKTLYEAHRMRHAFIKSKEKRKIHFFDYKSPNKNSWICRIELRKKDYLRQGMAYYYNNKGLVGLNFLQTEHGFYLTYITGHLFRRYNERRKLNLVKPEEIIKHYMNDNSVYQLQRLELVEEQIWKIFCLCDTGVMLGTVNDKLRLIKLNTYITKEMLRGNQIEMENQLKDLLEKYKKDNHII